MSEDKRPAVPPPGTGHRQRLRSRFLHGGIQSLADYEQIELLLTYAIPRRDVKPLAKQLLERFGSLEKLLDASGAELADCGLSTSSATLLLLMRNLCTLYLEQKVRDADLLDTPQRVEDFLRMKLGGGRKETLIVLYLNSRNALIHYECYPGTVDRATIYAREVAEVAIKCQAVGVIIAHNHPSGICEPSVQDLDLTRSLRQALDTLGIAFYDHLIVTPSACRSVFGDRRKS